MKKPSGTMLMSMSVDGSRIHRSLLKKIWWNMMKYLEKSVDMMSPRAVISPKNRPVPMQREDGRARPHPGFGGSHERQKGPAPRTRHTLPDGQGLQEKDLHVFHMGNFTFIEEFPPVPLPWWLVTWRSSLPPLR